MRSPLSTPSLLAAAGLAGGFAIAQRSKRRELGGAAFAAAGFAAGHLWRRRIGMGPALGLCAGYAAAMGGSHPLAKKLGPWPSVAAVTGAVVVASEVAQRVGCR